MYQSSEEAVGEAAKAYVLKAAKGKRMSDNDLIIYGICVANNEILLTEDRAFGNLQNDFIKLID